jgi:hypothetical protein
MLIKFMGMAYLPSEYLHLFERNCSMIWPLPFPFPPPALPCWSQCTLTLLILLLRLLISLLFLLPGT